MVTYSIKDIESLTGIKSHTLRIWEKRYDIIQPKRTETNIRYYTEEDLRCLLNISYLYKHGYKISQIAKMDESEIGSKISHHSNSAFEGKDKVDMLMLQVLEFDSFSLNQVFDQNLEQTGLEETMEALIYPLMDRLAMAWMVGSFMTVHESFVLGIIRSKLKHCIESLPEDNTHNPTYLLYLSPGESQILSLLYIHYILKKNKCKVINLGENISLEDLNAALDIIQPDYLFSIFNAEIPKLDLQDYSNRLNVDTERTNLLFAGYQVASKTIEWPTNTRIFKSLKDTIRFIHSSSNLF